MLTLYESLDTTMVPASCSFIGRLRQAVLIAETGEMSFL